MATRPTASTPIATLGAGVRRDARPPEKSATPRVAAAPSAAPGDSSWFSQSILAGHRLAGRTLQAMASPDRGWIDKAHALHKRQHPVVRRVVVAIVGGVLLLVGIALLVLPGPGVIVILAGIAVLSLEFEWAERLVARIRAVIASVTSRWKKR